MDIANKEKKTADTIGWFNFAILILLGYLTYKYQFINEASFGLGGSLTIFTITGILIALSYFVKPFILEFSLGTIIITGILIFNLLSFWEISGRPITTEYLILSYISFYSFIPLCLFVMLLPFKKRNNLNEPERTTFFRKIVLTLFLPMFVFGLIFAILSGLAVYDILKSEPNAAISCPLLKITYMAVFWIVIAFFVTFIYLSKIKDEDIRKFLLEEKLNIVNYDIRKVKKYFGIFFFLIIFLGSVVETQRGMWVMWIETILLLGLMSLIIWKIYKHIFQIGKA